MIKSFVLKLTVSCMAIIAQFTLQGQPCRIHSHNDYQRNIPFYRAYSQQVNSMEADVYIDPSSETGLLVAHDPQELSNAYDIEELYLKPIAFIFAQNDGRPWKNEDRSFMLMVDLKTTFHPTIDRLIAKLKKYPEVFDPSVNPYAVQIVITTGNPPAPADFNTFPAFILFDGLIKVDYTEDQLKRVAMISEPFSAYSKWKADGLPFPESDQKVIRKLVEKAHQQGKPIRFWAAPDNPTAWKALQDLGVDIINTDNPEACTLYFKSQGE